MASRKNLGAGSAIRHPPAPKDFTSGAGSAREASSSVVSSGIPELIERFPLGH